MPWPRPSSPRCAASSEARHTGRRNRFTDPPGVRCCLPGGPAVPPYRRRPPNLRAAVGWADIAPFATASKPPAIRNTKQDSIGGWYPLRTRSTVCKILKIERRLRRRHEHDGLGRHSSDRAANSSSRQTVLPPIASATAATNASRTGSGSSPRPTPTNILTTVTGAASPETNRRS